MIEKIKIAIIDDHKMFLEGISSVLEHENNFDIIFTETSAVTALKRIDPINTPDIIITDISMPEMNGIEFIKIVKKRFPTIKILVVSMFKEIQSFENIDGYLLKETDNSELIKTINSIVNEDESHFSIKNTDNNIEFNISILTQREKEIIQLISEEFTTDEIALKLFLSKGTVETHRKNIFLKLKVKNIAGLIKKAIYLGVVKY